MTATATRPTPGPLTPYLCVRGADAAIRFYTQAFGAREDFRLVEPGGKVGHSELLIGDSRLMLADEYPDFGALSPVAIGGTAVGLQLYVPDVDATMALAEAHGATVLRAAKDEFYGDRSGVLTDPFGHRWHLATRKESVTPEQMQARWSAMLAG